MELMDFTSQVSVMAATLNVKSVTHCLFFTAGEPPPPPTLPSTAENSIEPVK